MILDSSREDKRLLELNGSRNIRIQSASNFFVNAILICVIHKHLTYAMFWNDLLVTLVMQVYPVFH
jgi:hypothetical protein